MILLLETYWLSILKEILSIPRQDRQRGIPSEGASPMFAIRSVIDWIRRWVLHSRPDLIISNIDQVGSIEIIHHPREGRRRIFVPIRVVVENAGNRKAEGQFTISAFLRARGGDEIRLEFGLSRDDISPRFAVTSNLEAGDSVSVDGFVELPWSTLNQRIEVFAAVDDPRDDEFSRAFGRIRESDEKNNFSPPLPITVI